MIMNSVIVSVVCILLMLCLVSANNQTDICRTTEHNCRPMRETCFKNANGKNGYLCCRFDKAFDTYIYQENKSTPIISCDPLKCIVCDSRKHPKCGETFEYSDKEVKDLGLKVDCAATGTTNPRACRKMVITQGDDVVVLRSCWNTTNAKMHYYPNKCLELEGVESCYCTQHGCNGQGALAGSILAILTTAILALWCKNVNYM